MTAKVVIYEAFVEGELDAPKHLARTVRHLYFEPKYAEFHHEQSGVSPTRFHSRSKGLIQFLNKVTPKLEEFLETRFSQSF